jgi:hypothetical protein
MSKTNNKNPLRLYTVGYRDATTDKRLEPEEFYGNLPEEATVIDIRSNPYSPFAPDYTRGGVERAVQQYKPGVKIFHHLKALGNVNRESSGKRISPPEYVDPEKGFPQLEEYLREYGAVVIFCACSLSSKESSTHRCHRFFVADEMASRMPDLEVIHWEERSRA